MTPGDIIDVLDSVSEKFVASSKERDAIELAQIALLYPRHIRREEDFNMSYNNHFDPFIWA